ncbi:Aldehyde dehydrogenase domain protein, partial [mine drainage metagenome]
MAEGGSDLGRGALWIGGSRRPPASGTFAPVRDPSTGGIVGEAAVASDEEARAAVDAAAEREASWGGTPGHVRAQILHATAERLAADREPMATRIAREVGKPIADARVEVDRAVGVFRFAAEEVRQLGGETFPADAYER